MASSSGTSSGSGSGSGASVEEVMDLRKRKRMLSNRESARRSRQRKQKHLDDLTAQVSQLKKENGQVVAALGVTTQHYLSVEAENSVLRTQMMELTTRLESLNEILSCVSTTSDVASSEVGSDDGMTEMMMMMTPWGSSMAMMMNGVDNQSVMPPVHMFQYC